MNSNKIIFNKIIKVIPILLIVGVMPLISYGKVDLLRGNVFLNWNGKSAEIDFFSYYRMVFTFVMAIISVVILVLNKKIVKDISVYKYALFYIMCIFISVLFSPYKDIAMRGFVFRYEGMIALLSYVFLLIVSINLIDNEYSIKYVIYFIVFSAIVISIIGIAQYFGYDIFQNIDVQRVMIPKEHEYLVGKLKFFMDENMKVYSTLGNSNYVGSYFSLVLPMLIILATFSNKKRIIFIIASALGLVTVVLSDSATGIIAIIVAMASVFILLRKEIMNNYKNVLGIGFCIILALALFDFSGNKVVYNKVKKTVHELVYEIEVGKEKSKLEDVLLGGNTAQISYKDKEIRLESYNDELVFKDENNNNLSVELDKEKNKWNFVDNKYSDISIEFVSIIENENKFIKVNIDDDVTINLTTVDDEFKYITYAGRIIDKKDIKLWGKEGKEELLTSRYYIWSRTLPIIAERPLVGYGPDTFVAEFPQYDYVGMYKAYDKTNMIVDKPHNMYIQIAQSTGILSLVSFLAIVLLYIKDSIKIFKFLECKYSIVGVAIFAGIVGYLISGLFNDSIVSIAPIFYVMLGTGIRINKIVLE